MWHFPYMDILIVEDDDSIAEPLERGLAREGFNTLRVSTGAAALASAPVDVVLLDLGLPDMDGGDVCKAIRLVSQVPIIVVSARGEEIDRVLLLEMGADDYLVKPFGFHELVARIGAITRRSGGFVHATVGSEITVIGEMELDRRSHRVSVSGDQVVLTPKEFELLAMLATDPGRVFTRTEIFDEVWDPHWYGPTKTLDVHVAAVRKKLGDPGWIETVRGIGFRIMDPRA
ncbi:unannotated protein [freshwater metagenome]|uniref:Unannotated protein n=1 Tax=freshwater metagenome TaxID=449393 RepID=A0A6J7R254_9ZZZZ